MKIKNFKLKIAGTGHRKAFLEKLIKELKLEDKVEFIGWVSDKKSFFNQIDILIFPSQRETFGLVLLEAMKYRKPIVATDCDGPKEIIRNEIDGMLVSLEPLDNTEDRVTEAIIKIVNQPALVNQMIENSFIRLKEKFSYKSMEAHLA